MSELLAQARRGGYALGYFESWDQYSLEAALEAAEEAGAPAILGFGALVTNQAWLDRGGVVDLARCARRLAESASVPAAVLFNEAQSFAQLRQALDAGCNAVMLDNGEQSFDQRVESTQQVVALARRYGADVEAELNHLPDATVPSAGEERTDPAQARRFVEQTGVDALAVAIGNTHLLLHGVAQVDVDLLAAIGAATQTPLVLHGGSGFPVEAIPSAIHSGVAKFNVGTRLKATFLEGLRQALPAAQAASNIHPFVGSRDNTDVIRRGMALMKAEILRLMRLYGCAGRASA